MGAPALLVWPAAWTCLWRGSLSLPHSLGSGFHRGLVREGTNRFPSGRNQRGGCAPGGHPARPQALRPPHSPAPVMGPAEPGPPVGPRPYLALPRPRGDAQGRGLGLPWSLPAAPLLAGAAGRARGLGPCPEGPSRGTLQWPWPTGEPPALQGPSGCMEDGANPSAYWSLSGHLRHVPLTFSKTWGKAKAL